MNSHTFSYITQRIATSKKYKGLYVRTIERIVRQSIERYGEKHAEEKARNILHQVWGAYYPIRPNFEKLYEKLLEQHALICHSEFISGSPGFRKQPISADRQVRNDKSLIKIKLKQTLMQILNLHTSTKERIPILDDFYTQIFDITGIPNSIIDYACGFNPLTIPWMNLPEETSYYALDIDKEEITFLRRMFKTYLYDICESRSAGCGSPVGKQKIILDIQDIFEDHFPYADVVFMFKLLQNLEQQQKNSCFEVMKKQQCKYLVVSFPLKSIGGKEKGMTDFYTQQFIKQIEGEKWQYKKLTFRTELVFVVKK